MNNKEVELAHEKVMKGLREMLGKDPDNFKFKAVGYLDICDPPFETGYIPADFVEKLRFLTQNRRMVIMSLGHHDCEFCITERIELTEDAQSSTEYTLKDEINKIEYKFPDMLFHYIKVHGFMPPQDFIDFVMREGFLI